MSITARHWIFIFAVGFGCAGFGCGSDDTGLAEQEGVAGEPGDDGATGDPAIGDSALDDESGAEAAASPDGEPDGDPVEPGPQPITHTPCPHASLIGAFVVELADGFSRVSGRVDDKPPLTPALTIDEAGDCRLIESVAYECDPACAVGTTCSSQLVCEPSARAVDAGTLTVSGLGTAGDQTLTLEAGGSGYYQAAVPPPPHPAFAPGGALELSAAGAVSEPFSMRTQGVEDFVLTLSEIPVAEDMTVLLTWEAPAVPRGKIKIALDIGHHGGSPADIVCEADDDGEFEIPQALVAQLFEYGVWGFPTIEISRAAIGSTETSAGCVEFVAESATLSMEVAIEGVVSCSGPDECEEGQTCEGLRCL